MQQPVSRQGPCFLIGQCFQLQNPAPVSRHLVEGNLGNVDDDATTAESHVGEGCPLVAHQSDLGPGGWFGSSKTQNRTSGPLQDDGIHSVARRSALSCVPVQKNSVSR